MKSALRLHGITVLRYITDKLTFFAAVLQEKSEKIHYKCIYYNYKWLPSKRTAHLEFKS